MKTPAVCLLAICLPWLIGSRSISAQSMLALGDSITYGATRASNGYFVPGGYRAELYTDLLNQGYQPNLLGSTTGNLSPLLTKYGQVNQAGHPGYTTQQTTNSLKGTDGSSGNDGGYWLNGGNGTGRSALSPSIVLLHIGTNNVYGENAAQMSADLSILLSDLNLDLPTAQVFVASLIPRTDNAAYKSTEEPYNALILADVAAQGSNFHFVDMHDAFPASYLSSDGLHSNQTGYGIMGDTWAAAIEKVSPLPEPSVVPICWVEASCLDSTAQLETRWANLQRRRCFGACSHYI